MDTRKHVLKVLQRQLRKSRVQSSEGLLKERHLEDVVHFQMRLA